MNIQSDTGRLTMQTKILAYVKLLRLKHYVKIKLLTLNEEISGRSIQN